jgi:peptidyl-dipeptidase A
MNDRSARRLVPAGAALAVLLLAAVAPAAGQTAKGPPTPEQAQAFVERAENLLLEHWAAAERAAWVQANFITHDTELIASRAMSDLLQLTAGLAQDAARYDGLDLPVEVRRKLRLLKTSLPLAAPADTAAARELAETAAAMSSAYGTGRSCPPAGGDCLDLGQLERIMATSRDPDQLLAAWRGWRTISPPMREMYRRFVRLGNQGAVELGFRDLGELWRSGYDMSPAEFAAEVERLWGQVQPLYDALHCHVRARLVERYGPEVVPPRGPIPAHLLGNMWAQSWGNIYDTVAPIGGGGLDVTEVLQESEVDARAMVEYGEGFFTSLGFDELPQTFWERSLFTKPRDREVVCHASAWAVDFEDDLRIKMCIEVDEEDFVTVHHELGHVFYFQAYAELDPLYRQGANDGFHEAVGDVVALSVTPDYLVRVGLLDKAPEQADAVPQLMRIALEKIAFLPFGLLMDQWRWQVFAGDITPERYNQAWWELRERYQGVAPPVARSEADFDPGAKYHIPANTPYTRYFLAHILQFQMHRELCRAAGHEGPLHRCSIYGNEQAGRRLREMMALGASHPWPDALEVATGQRRMDASAIVDYFRPLLDWLEQQNQDRQCGW